MNQWGISWINKLLEHSFHRQTLQRVREKEGKIRWGKLNENLFGFLVKHGRNTCWSCSCCFSLRRRRNNFQICLKMHSRSHNDYWNVNRNVYSASDVERTSGEWKSVERFDQTFGSTTGASVVKYSPNSFVTNSNPFANSFFIRRVMWAAERASFIVFLSAFFVLVDSRSPPTYQRGRKTWIKNCYIHMKIYSLYANISHTSLSQIAFFVSSSGRAMRGGNMNSTYFFSLIVFCITLFDMNSKVKNELLIRNEQWVFFLVRERCSIWTSKFYDKKRGIALLGRNCFQWCIISPTRFGTRFNEFRSPNLFRTTFFYGQLTCISIDIQNLFIFFVSFVSQKCMHTHTRADEKRPKAAEVPQNWSQKLFFHCASRSETTRRERN